MRSHGQRPPCEGLQQLKESTIMKKQFVKMAAVAVMVLGMASAQSSAAEVSLRVNLSNGQVSISSSDDCCHHQVDNHRRVDVNRREAQRREEMRRREQQRRHAAARRDNHHGRR